MAQQTKLGNNWAVFATCIASAVITPIALLITIRLLVPFQLDTIPAIRVAADTPSAWAGDLLARVTWGTLCFFLVCACIYAYLASLITLKEYFRRKSVVISIILWVFLSTAMLVSFVFSDQFDNPLRHALVSNFWENREFTQTGYFILKFTLAIGLIAALAVIITMAAIGSAILPKVGFWVGDEERELELVHLLSNLITRMMVAGSLIFVLSVQAYVSLQIWPITMTDPGQIVPARRLGMAMAVYWGAINATVLLAIYAATAFFHDRRLMAIASRRCGSSEPTLASKWLKRNGVRRDLASRLPDLGAGLAPLITGPLGSFLADLTP